MREETEDIKVQNEPIEDEIDLDVELDDEDLTDDDIEPVKKQEEPQKEDADTKSPKKKVQSREENKLYAELRRKNAELDKKNKELEVKANEADFNARKKAIPISTLSELGIDSIRDDNDLLLCEEYQKAVDDGSENPILEANKALRNRIQEEKQKIIEEREQEEKNRLLVQKDQEELRKKYNIEASEVIKNKEFMSLYEGLITYGNLTNLYERYLAVVSKKEEAANEQAKAMGVIPDSSSKKIKTEKSILDLDDEDFLKAFKQKYH